MLYGYVLLIAGSAAWSVVLIYGSTQLSCSQTLSLLPAGLQLVVRDAQMVPEELFFQLQKPPQHGSLLKSTAESSGPMAAGSCIL